MRFVPGALSILFIGCLPSFGQGPSSGSVSGGVTTSGTVTSGNFSAVMPVYSTLGQDETRSGSLLYLEPYADWFDQGSLETGTALEFRHLFSGLSQSAPLPEHLGLFSEGFYVGGDLSLDLAEMSNGMRFWQLGVGAEVGTRYLELRGRYQFPLDDGETSKQRSVQRIHQTDEVPLSGGATALVDQRLTITSTLTLLTESMEGWHIDCTVLVPEVDEWVDVRLMGGYASYHPQSNDAVERSTWRFGAEVRPLPSVVMGATYYDNQDFVDGHWLYSIGFELPFELKEIGDGKGGFWTRIKNSFKPQRRSLIDRMVEPGRRHRMVMQMATSPQKLETKIAGTTTVSVILADGRVVYADRVSGAGSTTWTSGTGSSSVVTMSGSMTTGASRLTSSGSMMNDSASPFRFDSSTQLTAIGIGSVTGNISTNNGSQTNSGAAVVSGTSVGFVGATNGNFLTPSRPIGGSTGSSTGSTSTSSSSTSAP